MSDNLHINPARTEDVLESFPSIDPPKCPSSSLTCMVLGILMGLALIGVGIACLSIGSYFSYIPIGVGILVMIGSSLHYLRICNLKKEDIKEPESDEEDDDFRSILYR